MYPSILLLCDENNSISSHSLQNIYKFCKNSKIEITITEKNYLDSMLESINKTNSEYIFFLDSNNIVDCYIPDIKTLKNNNVVTHIYEYYDIEYKQNRNILSSKLNNFSNCLPIITNKKIATNALIEAQKLNYKNQLGAIYQIIKLSYPNIKFHNKSLFQKFYSNKNFETFTEKQYWNLLFAKLFKNIK